METWINLLAVIGSAMALYFLLRKPAEKFEAKTEARFEKLEAKIDRVHTELTEFRIETREILTRHDVKIDNLETRGDKLDAKVEARLPKLLVP